MDSDVVFFSYAKGNPDEGGMARNFAFFREMQRRGAKIHNFTSLRLIDRFMYVVVNVLRLLSAKGKKILILQTVLLTYIFPFVFFRFWWFRSYAAFIIRRVSMWNTLYIEINDLIYEQAIDMDLGGEKTSLLYQRFIFSQKDVRFIFASQLLADHACKHYGVKKEYMQTVLNGAPAVEEVVQTFPIMPDKDKITFIYAGTLNKGREIEKVIDVFVDQDHAELHFIGIGGDWIKDLPYNNICYLGNFPEQKAMQIVAMADVGIVPYNEDKLYYNICYPTKVSFYLSAGIPLLSTPLRETQRALRCYPFAAFFRPMAEWRAFVNILAKEEVLAAKEMLHDVQSDFRWDKVLSKMQL